jgi:hypothetical protein
MLNSFMIHYPFDVCGRTHFDLGIPLDDELPDQVGHEADDDAGDRGDDTFIANALNNLTLPFPTNPIGPIRVLEDRA